jgi:type I restriction enzyme S subunit
MNVPALRFKEFSGDWDEKTFQDVSKINQGLQIPISDRFLEIGENRHFYITNEFLREDSKKQYFIENPPNSVLCIESDVLMTRTGNTGKVVTNIKGAFHNNFFKITYDKNMLNKVFLCEFLCLIRTQSLILKLAGTSTIPDLNHSDFYKIKIQYPSLPEQTKIANFLTAVDDKITLLTKKADLLSQYKKGVMQQIFSQELRFKDDDGQEFPEWEILKLDCVFSEITEKTNQDIETYSISAGKGFVSQEEKFGRDISGNQNKNYIKLMPFEFSYNKGNSKTFKYGCVYSNTTGKVIAVPNIFISFNAKLPIATNYYAKLFEWHYLDAFLKKIISSSARMDGLLNVNKKDFFNIDVPYPSLPEQTKIANFLTAIDEKITNNQAKLDAVKQYKQGLLQQMFV